MINNNIRVGEKYWLETPDGNRRFVSVILTGLNFDKTSFVDLKYDESVVRYNSNQFEVEKKALNFATLRIYKSTIENENIFVAGRTFVLIDKERNLTSNVVVDLAGKNNDGDIFVDLRYKDGSVVRIFGKNISLIEQKQNPGNYIIKILPAGQQQANPTYNASFISEVDKAVIKDFALEIDSDGKYEYTPSELWSAVKGDMPNMNYGMFVALIDSYRNGNGPKQPPKAEIPVQPSKPTRRPVRKPSMTPPPLANDDPVSYQEYDSYIEDEVISNRTIESVAQKINKGKGPESLFTEKIHLIDDQELIRVFSINETKLLEYPIELFKLVIDKYEIHLGVQKFGFTILELDFEKKLIRIIEKQNNIWRKLKELLPNNLIGLKIELLKRILQLIHRKRVIINETYRIHINAYQKFKNFKISQIREKKLFITEKDAILFEKDIEIAIINYIQYNYAISGTFVSSIEQEEISGYFSLSGFVLSNSEVLEMNKLKVTPWDLNYNKVISKYIDQKIITQEKYMMLVTLPLIILQQQTMIEKAILKLRQKFNY